MSGRGRGRGRKRKASEPAAVEEPGNTIDFEKILRISQILPTDAVGDSVSSEPVSIDTSHDVVAVPPGCGGDNYSLPALNMTRCASDEVFGHVPMQLREKVWRGEFVHLSLLLKGSFELTEYCSGGALVLGPGGTLETKQRDCPSKILSIDAWTDAFIIFTAIMIVKHKDQAPDLLKYMFTIREAAARQGGFAWRAYDEQFRLRQASGFSSWAVINNDLWWRCMIVGSNVPTKVATVPAHSPRPHPCMDFNKGLCSWPNCRFAHVCMGCGGAHAVSICPKQAANATLGQPLVNI